MSGAPSYVLTNAGLVCGYRNPGPLAVSHVPVRLPCLPRAVGSVL